MVAVAGLLPALTDALERVLRVLHLVDDHDVGLRLCDRPANRTAAVDLAEHLEPGGVLERHPNGLDDE